MLYRWRCVKDIYKKYRLMLTSSQKKWSVVVAILTLGGAICELLGVTVILPLVQAMIGPQVLWSNKWVSSVLNALGINSNRMLVWAIGIFVIAVYIIKNLYLFFLAYIRVKFTCKIQRELSVEMMSSYMKRGYIFFLDAGIGELLRGIQSSVDGVQMGLYQFFRIVVEALTIAFISIYVMISDIRIAVCMIVLALVGVLVMAVGCQNWIKKCSEAYYHYAALVNKSALQAFQGIKEILVMQKQDYFIESYKQNYTKKQKGWIGQQVASESPSYIIEAVCISGLMVAVCIETISIADASALIPQLATFAVAAFRILPSLGRISNYLNQFMTYIPSINDTYNNIMEIRSKQETNNQLKDENASTDCIGPDKFKDVLSIENVTWKYPRAKNYVLKNVCLEINKGQSVAFVGKSGAGKTTMADIILGLLHPQTGCVKIDGVDINEIYKRRRGMIGFVPQNVNLLDDTVRRNVAFGVKDEEIDDVLVWKVLEQAQLKDIIESNAQGLDTEIGERGVRFSGGQRQRFAIARALYHQPDILILDEATSALDTETETLVMDAIESLQGHITLIIIAHRITTIEKCDVIYEIENGRAIQKNFNDLL